MRFSFKTSGKDRQLEREDYELDLREGDFL